MITVINKFALVALVNKHTIFNLPFDSSPFYWSSFCHWHEFSTVSTFLSEPIKVHNSNTC